MKAHARSIIHLFDGKRRYLVPLFQRQYVWSKDKQWELLWEDISRMAERKAAGLDGPAHFMGAIVLDQIRTYGNEVQAHLIIDGQQRLTTFQVVLAALRDVSRTLGITMYAEETDRYLRNTGIMQKEEEEQFKLWPSRMDQQVFTSVIEGAPIPDPTHRIAQAYKFFSDTVSRYTRSENPEQLPATRVELLFQALRDDLEIVSIEMEGDDDPQVIFETLNARGEALLPSDLLRNLLFWRAQRNNEDRDRLYDQYWLPLDQKFWKQEERLGRLKRPRIDIFLQHYLESQKAEEVNVARLFHEYKTWAMVREPFPTVEAELISLATHSTVYAKFITPDPTEGPVGTFLWRIRQIDVGTIYPLLLFILTHPDQNQADVEGMLVDLESYLFRRLVCRLTPKNYNRVFAVRGNACGVPSSLAGYDNQPEFLSACQIGIEAPEGPLDSEAEEPSDVASKYRTPSAHPICCEGLHAR